MTDSKSEQSNSGARSNLPRSFVRRTGRMTTAQRRALQDLWGRYGAPDEGPLDGAALFERELPLCVEIGFGMGDSLAAIAAARPDWGHLGIEVHEPGIGRLLNLAAEQGLSNLKVIQADAVQLLQTRFPSASVDQFLIYFPDPWPKKRHHKRRLIQLALVELLCDRLRAGGRLELATDWEDYAWQMLEVLDGSPLLDNQFGAGHYSPRPQTRPVTKFERRGQRLGHGIWDLAYVRNEMVPEDAK